MTGFRVALGGAQALTACGPISPRSARSSAAACRSARSAAGATSCSSSRPLGPIYQAGTLSGNPVAMSAGITTLELVAAPGFHQRLAAATDRLMLGLRTAAARCGVPLATNHVCGMFGFFFTSAQKVSRFEDVMVSDAGRFRTFFHAMLDEGIYLAPSAFEAGFLSAAHTDAHIDATVAAAERVMRKL